MTRRVKGPGVGTILAWLGIIGTILGIIGFVVSDLPNLFGGAATPSQSDVVSTLIALEQAKLDAEFQLTQIALGNVQAANQSTQQAIAQQEANVQATLGALQVQQADAIATSNAIAAMTSTADAANAQATQAAQDATATANFLAQLEPTSTPLPTATPPPAEVGDHRSIQVADVALRGADVVFAMRVAQPVPDGPQDGLSYIWALDTDHNPESGVKIQDIGVDQRVIVTFTDGTWLGEVRSVQADGALGEPFRFSDVDVSGPNIAATLNPAEVGLPIAFDWLARVEQGEQTFSPFFPETGHLSVQ